MKKSLLICVLLFIINVESIGLFHLRKRHDIPPPPGIDINREIVYSTYFSQRLDHFDPTDERVWDQRYFVSTDYFSTRKRDVAFLMIGGEGEAERAWMVYGAWLEPAEKHGALLFQLEHRFYGESQPFSDLSLENLRYLSSAQALADIANFITGINELYELAPDVKWIVIGGSYSGSLAAWARVKYPHLIHGAVSDSGPLLAKLDFYEYMQVVADDLASVSQECVDSVRIAIDQVETLLRNPKEENVTSLFNLCDSIEADIENTQDVANFFGIITSIFAETAQYNNIISDLLTIDNLCMLMTDERRGREIDRLVEVYKVGLFILDEASQDCVDYSYESSLEELRDINLLDGWARQWYYQTCTEFGWYQTTNQEIQVFGNRSTLSFSTDVCTDIYGQEFNENFISQQIRETNIAYGGLDIETTNLVFVHGSFDPWHAVGLTETRNPNIPVIFINGTAHCANIYEDDPDDPPQLIAARAEVNRLIDVWLIDV